MNERRGGACPQNRSEDNLARAVPSHFSDDAGAEERILDAEALVLFAAVHALCGTAVVHEFRDREWWAAEAARVGSNWPALLALQKTVLAWHREHEQREATA
jgi:hypothetical protein